METLRVCDRRRGEYVVKSKPKNKQKFVLGDRVKLRAQGRFHAMTRGIVVPYHGRHDPENPRVRWGLGVGRFLESRGPDQGRRANLAKALGLAVTTHVTTQWPK